MGKNINLAEETSRELAGKIKAALKDVLPKDMGFIIVFAREEEGDISITSNMSDKGCLLLLEHAADMIQNPEIEASDII